MNHPLLELDHVQKTYAAPDGGAPVTVLTDVCLQLAAGEAVAIIGPSGSGKSTLLNILGALDLPTAGRALIAGRDLATLGENDLAALRNRELGYIFQQHHLLPQCTVWENVLIPTLTAPRELELTALTSPELPGLLRERGITLASMAGLPAMCDLGTR